MYKGFVFIVIILLSACAEGRKSDAELKAAVHAYVQTDALVAADLVSGDTAADADSEQADVGDQADGSSGAELVGEDAGAEIAEDTGGVDTDLCPPGVCDDGNPCTIDLCDADGKCDVDLVGDGESCGDFGGTCKSGECVGGELADGGPTDVADTAGPDSGVSDTSKPDAAVPDAAPEVVDCPGGCDDGNPCTADSCGSTGCLHANSPGPCDDGNACTTADACSAKACAGGPAPDCGDGNACTDDSCDKAKGCVNTNNTAACSDGNPCTVGDVCAAAVCKAGTNTGCAPPTPEICNGLDDDQNGKTDDVTCGGAACTCGPSGVATCGVACTTCPDDGDLAIPIDDAGIKKVICAHDYPAWGIGAESPGTLSDKGDGTVVDSLTGLAWQKVVDAGAYKWGASKSYCDGLVLAGKSDWRWPTSFELESLVNYASPASCAVLPAVFGTYSCDTYWAATPFQGVSSSAWEVEFSYGASGGYSIVGNFRVRCVR